MPDRFILFCRMSKRPLEITTQKSLCASEGKIDQYANSSKVEYDRRKGGMVKNEGKAK